MKKTHKKSPFFVIGVIIGICMLLCAVYAVYDGMTDVGFWPGIHGALVFLIAEPILFILLEIDILVWFLYKRRNEKMQSREDEKL